MGGTDEDLVAKTLEKCTTASQKPNVLPYREKFDSSKNLLLIRTWNICDH